MRTGLAALAIVFLAAHLPSLPPSLEDLDSVNFALGVRQFDVAQHQPHPPGYPVYIALARISTGALHAAGIPAAASRGLAIWSALAGALTILLVAGFFRALDRSDSGARAVLSAVLLACAPLFWFSALRPLSDMVGLAAAFAALVPIAGAITTESGSRAARLLMLGAFVAGVAIGVRSQTFLLTLPLLAVTLARPRSGIPPRPRLLALAAFAAGILLWALPLIAVSGGPGAYLKALGSQGAEDFSGVVMVWTHRNARVAVYALLHTFVLPWRSIVLAAIVLALAAMGSLVLLWRSPRAFVLLAAAFGPYAVFHLLFQETATVRYALPLLPPVAYLAVTALASVHRPAAIIGVSSLAVAGLVLSVPAGMAYGREAAPVFRMLDDMRVATPAPAAIGMHRPVFTETRRARSWTGPMPGDLLSVPRDYEWLELTRMLRISPDATVWFIADPRRTDLVLMDPVARARSYRWPFDAGVFVGGARPGEMTWHSYFRPGWFLEQGWALNPEVAGISNRDGWGPHRRPSIGWVRARPEEALLLFGGRHLGSPADPPSVVSAQIDGREILRLELAPGFFFHTTRIPAGMLQGEEAYGRLTVTATSTTGGTSPPVAIEQFNLQAPDVPMVGFADGWHEPEYNPNTRRSWRWLSDRSVLWVYTGGRDMDLCLEGESPRKYYDSTPTLRVAAGSQELRRFSPDDDFLECFPVPASALASANGRVAIESSLTHQPAERDGAADRRRLGLRMYAVRLVPTGRRSAGGEEETGGRR